MNTYRREVPDGEFHHRMHRNIGGRDGERLGFEWFGGAYIQVCRGEAFASPKEVINVWDYATDSPRYPRTVGGMTDAIHDWITNYGADNLLHDVRENWRYM